MAPASEGLCLPGIFLIRVLEAYSTAPAKQARGRMGGSGLGGWCGSWMGSQPAEKALVWGGGEWSPGQGLPVVSRRTVPWHLSQP